MVKCNIWFAADQNSNKTIFGSCNFHWSKKHSTPQPEADSNPDPDANILKFIQSNWTFWGFSCKDKTFCVFEPWMSHVWQAVGREFILASKPNHTNSSMCNICMHTHTHTQTMCSLPIFTLFFLNQHICHTLKISSKHPLTYVQATHKHTRRLLLSKDLSVDKDPGGYSEVLL